MVNQSEFAEFFDLAWRCKECGKVYFAPLGIRAMILTEKWDFCPDDNYTCTKSDEIGYKCKGCGREFFSLEGAEIHMTVEMVTDNDKIWKGSKKGGK